MYIYIRDTLSLSLSLTHTHARAHMHMYMYLSISNYMCSLFYLFSCYIRREVFNKACEGVLLYMECCGFIDEIWGTAFVFGKELKRDGAS